MSLEEAIKILKKNKPTSDPRACGIELCEAVDVAIGCIEKCVPKSPVRHDYEESWIDACPNCGYEFDLLEVGEVDVCPNCGQKLKWSEE